MCLTRPSLSSNLFIVTQHAKKVTKSAFFSLSLSSRSQSGACCTSDPFCTAGIRGGEQTTIWRKSRDTLHREGVIGGRNGSAEVSERQILGNCLCGARGGRNFEKKKKKRSRPVTCRELLSAIWRRYLSRNWIDRSPLWLGWRMCHSTGMPLCTPLASLTVTLSLQITQLLALFFFLRPHPLSRRSTFSWTLLSPPPLPVISPP